LKDRGAWHKRSFVDTDTAFGPCRMVYSYPPFSIKRVFLPGTCHDGFMEDEPPGGAHPAVALEAAKLLCDYFEGKNIEPHWEWFDLANMTQAQQRVLKAVFDIPRGKVRSYGEVALMAGIPRGARFVGNTLAKNHLPVFIPCHRVVLADGRIGGFGGGTWLKSKMIEIERLFPA